MNKIDFKDLPDETTPIDADNLNLMQTNIDNAKAEKTDLEDINSEISTLNNKLDDKINKTEVETLLAPAHIRLGLTNQLTISSAQDRQEIKVSFSKERFTKGELFPVNGGVLIGSDVNTVLVNAQIYFYTTVNLSTSKIITVRRNTSDLGTVSGRFGLALKQTVANICAVVPVQMGDTITINLTASANDIVDNNQSQTFFEVVKLN